MMMEAASSTKTLITTYRATRCYTKKTTRLLLNWWWRQHIPPKRYMTAYQPARCNKRNDQTCTYSLKTEGFFFTIKCRLASTALQKVYSKPWGLQITTLVE